MTTKEFYNHKFSALDQFHYKENNNELWFNPTSVDFETGNIEAMINDDYVIFSHTDVELINPSSQK